MQRSCGFVFVCSINIYQDQWCSYFIMCKNHQGRSFPDVVLFRLLVWVSLDWPRNLYFFSSLNHFTEEWLTCKKLNILNRYNLMRLEIRLHTHETITTMKAINLLEKKKMYFKNAKLRKVSQWFFVHGICIH